MRTSKRQTDNAYMQTHTLAQDPCWRAPLTGLRPHDSASSAHCMHSGLSTPCRRPQHHQSNRTRAWKRASLQCRAHAEGPAAPGSTRIGFLGMGILGVPMVPAHSAQTGTSLTSLRGTAGEHDLLLDGPLPAHTMPLNAEPVATGVAHSPTHTDPLPAAQCSTLSNTHVCTLFNIH